jgi:hypothetical protein
VAEPDTHLVIFLPWLRLKKSHRIAGVEFWPFRDDDGKASRVFRGAVRSLARILSSYRDRKGKQSKNCVIATIPDRGWSLDEDDLETVRWATSVLFLSSWASNEYFPRFGGVYVNSEEFRFVGQRFTGPMPVYIALVSRRRDGSKWDGGYKHGEVNFSIPLQCSTQDAAKIDETFLAALDTANAAKSDTTERLQIAMMFVQRSNADDDAMTLTGEALLMGSAFEQLFGGPSSSYGLGKKFGELFSQFGSVTVAEARVARSGIDIDTTKAEYAAAQPKWWVHRKWLEELYDVRSKATHKGHHAGRPWGWRLDEHLLMAAFVFPLTVKVLLAKEGRYELTDDDRDRCFAIDKLLAATNWAESAENGGPSNWSCILSQLRKARQSERIFQKMQELFADECDGGESEPPSSEESGSGSQ